MTLVAPVPGARSTSLDTRHQPRNGLRSKARLHRGRPSPDPLRALWRDPAQRQESKLDLADVLAEVARRRAADYRYEEAQWFDERGAALRECTFVRVIQHRGTDHGVARPLACHVRGCPDCERTRAARIVERYSALAAEMERPVMWTWTIPNVAPGELAAGLAHLRAAFTRLRRRAIFRGGRCRWRWPNGAPGHPCHPPVPAADCGDDCPTRTGRRAARCPVHRPTSVHTNGCPRSCEHAGHDKRRNCPSFEHLPVAGGVVSGEVTWSDAAGGSWHPHLHALIDAPWISWSEMRDLWRQLTCTTTGCRHACTACRGLADRPAGEVCRRCRGTATEPACTGAWSVWVEAVPRDDEEARQGAIREVLKYVGKPGGLVDSLDPDRIGEYLWATRRQRLVTGWGSLYRVQDEDDEPAATDELVIRWGWGTYRVPRICPHCGASTSEDDWLVPFRRPRLEAVRLDGRGGFTWRRPPPGAARDEVAAGHPIPDPIATSLVATSSQLEGAWA